MAVGGGGGPLAGLLHRMHRELERDAAGVADAVAHALGELDMMAVARCEIRAGLGNADDGLAGAQFVLGEAVVEIALQIERRHARIVGVVEPQLRAQAGLWGHRLLPRAWSGGPIPVAASRALAIGP